MQVQPVKAYPVQQPVQNVVAVDMNSFMVLNAVQRVSVKQLGALGEAVTCGAYPNSYLISDYNRMYQPMRNNKPYGDPLPSKLIYQLIIGNQVLNNYIFMKNHLMLQM